MTEITTKFLANPEIKICVRKCLIPVDNIEEADLVIQENPKSINVSLICRAENFKKSFGFTWFNKELTHYVFLNRDNKEEILKNFKPIKLVYLFQKHLK